MILSYKKIGVFFGLLLFGFFGQVQAQFADIDTTHPHFQAIEHLRKEGIIRGYEVEGKQFFRSLKKVSRAEALKILLLGAEIEISEKSADFPDVKTTDWFRAYVGTAKKRGLVKGFKDGRFHPHAQVTRAEFLKMASLAFDIPIDNAEDAQKWYKSYFDFGQAFKILNPSDTDPHESITRGELAEILFRLTKVSENGFRKAYIYSGGGSASYYNEGFAGRSTANGEIYDPYDMTAAHRTLPFNTKLRVWTDDKDKAIVVRVNDRGPYHSTRILDLSEKAFSLLAPISRGILEVHFEVLSENTEPIVIPDEIQSEISAEAKNIVVPTEVKSELQSEPEPKNTKKQNVLKKEAVSVFSGTTSFIAVDFFENLKLREPFPEVIRTGTVLSLDGIAEDWGHKKVTVFLQPLNNEKAAQTIFTEDVSGKNFVVPMQLLVPGKYHMGIVFDDDKRSRVTEVTVTEEGESIRYLAASKESFSEEFEVSVLPEKKKVIFSWDNNSKSGQLNKFDFGVRGAKEKFKTLYVEHGISELSLDYDFFKNFVSTQNELTLEVDWYGAESERNTLNTQTTNWSKIAYKNFKLVPGFLDAESSKISVSGFKRFPKDGASFVLSGKLNGALIADNAYLVLPDGGIKTLAVIKEGLHNFRIRVQPKDFGTHVIEIISNEGEILFNRAFYISKDFVLPVQPWERISVRSESISSIRHWINSWRSRKKLGALQSSPELNTFAQKYAEKMATEDFIGHVSPTGVTFEDRVKNEKLVGEYAENLSFGTTLDIALSGLQDSASHFKQITNSKWKKVGIGLTKNKKGYYVVQIFGN